MLNALKLYLGISDTSKDALLNQILSDCQGDFEGLTHGAFDSTNDDMERIVIEMAILKYNRLGTQHLASESYSGASMNYLDALPTVLNRRIQAYRKVRTIEPAQQH